ncbi:MAG TPA: DLW-39 family protein [Mycobacteriales bacterium]|nr:DLW-39 family protein [Mycobacteriales bacterium]
MRRPALIFAVLAAVGALLRRKRAAKSERDLWDEATNAPDLR